MGAMGKGLALDFAMRWPGIVQPYKADCAARRLAGGRVAAYPLPGEPGRFWAAFCTKHHWRDPSRYEWVRDGLAELSEILRAGPCRSVAVPPLGCGLGGLDWARVLPMIEQALEGTGAEVRIYQPVPAPSARRPPPR
jgi:hypothetical protein